MDRPTWIWVLYICTFVYIYIYINVYIYTYNIYTCIGVTLFSCGSTCALRSTNYVFCLFNCLPFFCQIKNYRQGWPVLVCGFPLRFCLRLYFHCFAEHTHTHNGRPVIDGFCSKETDSRGRTVAEGLSSDGVRYAGARSGVGRRFRSFTKLRLDCIGEFSCCCSSAQNTHKNGYNAQGVNLTFPFCFCCPVRNNR